jgi:copper transport protein
MTVNVPRQTLRLVGVAASLVTLVLATVSATLAHAQLVSVEPADGARLAASPAVVTVTFDEPVGLAPGGLRVIDSSGVVVDAGDDVVEGAAASQPVGPLSDGWYFVTWGIISEDGHVVRASSVFAVGDVEAPPTVSDARSAWFTPLLGVTRAFTDLSVLVAAGAWVAWWLLGARTIRVRRLAVGAATVALVASLLWLGLAWLDGGEAWLRTPAGLLGMVRVVGLVIAIVTAGRWPTLAAGATALALLSIVGGGHTGSSPLTAALVSVHLLAAAAWLGAAPAVLLVLTDRSLDDAATLPVVRRFSTLAPIVLVTVGVAGATLAVVLTDAFAGGLTTPYVLVLGAKVGLVATAAIIGFLARRRLRSTPSRSTMRRVFGIDVVLLPLIVAASAGLTLTGPHEGHEGHGAEAAHEDGAMARTGRCAMAVSEASVSLVADPARAGINELRVDGVPAGTLEVELRLTHAATSGAPISLEAVAQDGSWVAEGVLPLSGSWDATVAVRLDRFTEAQGSCTVSLMP